MVRFDEGDVLLKEWTLKKPVSELLYQLDRDRVTGRIWAAVELRDHLGDSTVRSALTNSAVHDESWAVRQKAIQVLGKTQSEAARDLLKARVLQDGDMRVRVAAIEMLGEFQDPELEPFFLEAAEIPSPRNAVRRAALDVLSAHEAEQ
jgi:aminopeptidase N